MNGESNDILAREQGIFVVFLNERDDRDFKVS